MDYAMLKEQIEGLEGEEREPMASLLKEVSLGGSINVFFERLLFEAASYEDFFERLYCEETLRQEVAWAAVARTMHSDWLECFQRRLHSEYVPLVDGALVLKGGLGLSDVSIPLPVDASRIEVHVFEDGDVNEYALDNIGVFQGEYGIGSYQLSGRFSLGLDADRLVVVLWRYRDNGSRVSMKGKMRSCCGCV